MSSATNKTKSDVATDDCANRNRNSTESRENKGSGKEQLDNKDEQRHKDMYINEETIDSGFISGLNTSSHLAVDEQEFEENTNQNENKQRKEVEEKLQQESSTFLDSGVIEPEEDFDDELDETIVAGTAATAATKKVEEAKSANVSGAIAKQLSEQQAGGAMRLKSNINSGIAEQFSALSLQTGGDGGINNLNGNNNKRNSTTSTTSNAARLNAWEEFYNQNSDGDTPLHLACLAGAEDVVVALLRLAIHPCLYNIQNDDAQTPLHMAALAAQPKILRILLVMGAEPNIRDRHGNTALHLAVNSGEEQCTRALLTPIKPLELQEGLRICGNRFMDKKLLQTLHIPRLPMDLEIRNYNGERCVHLAAQEGRINILRMLVAAGADINAREGKSGRTPLHMAIESCNEALVNFLLEECQNKLNLETATYAGLTAYQIACLLDKEQLQGILKTRGAEPLTPPDSDYELSDSDDLEDSKIFGDPSYFVGSYHGASAMRVA